MHKFYGEWVQELRRDRRMSQEELADKAGVSKNYISVLERNLPNYKTGALPQPSRKVVEAIAHALGVPVRESMEAAGYLPDAPSLTYEPLHEEEPLVAYFRGMPEDDRDELLQIAKMKYERNQRNQTTHGKRVAEEKAGYGEE